MFELNGIFFAMLGAAIASGLAGTGSAKGCGVAGEAAAVALLRKILPSSA